MRNRYPGLRVLYVPYIALRSLGLMATLVRKITGFGPSINRRRLLSLYRNVGAGSAQLLQDTGWQPSGHLLERLNRKLDPTPAQDPNLQKPALVGSGQER